MDNGAYRAYRSIEDGGYVLVCLECGEEISWRQGYDVATRVHFDWLMGVHWQWCPGRGREVELERRAFLARARVD